MKKTILAVCMLLSINSFGQIKLTAKESQVTFGGLSSYNRFGSPNIDYAIYNWGQTTLIQKKEFRIGAFYWAMYSPSKFNRMAYAGLWTGTSKLQLYLGYGRDYFKPRIGAWLWWNNSHFQLNCYNEFSNSERRDLDWRRNWLEIKTGKLRPGIIEQRGLGVGPYLTYDIVKGLNTGIGIHLYQWTEKSAEITAGGVTNLSFKLSYTIQ